MISKRDKECEGPSLKIRSKRILRMTAKTIPAEMEAAISDLLSLARKPEINEATKADSAMMNQTWRPNSCL
jgi:hypothetical protein